MRDAIIGIRGRTHANRAGVAALYPTTGTWSDYVYNRHIANSALRKTYTTGSRSRRDRGRAPPRSRSIRPRAGQARCEGGMVALLQQSSCAIELIGLQFFRAQTEVNACVNARVCCRWSYQRVNQHAAAPNAPRRPTAVHGHTTGGPGNHQMITVRGVGVPAGRR
jgi:hypothetical protein